MIRSAGLRVAKHSLRGVRAGLTAAPWLANVLNWYLATMIGTKGERKLLVTSEVVVNFLGMDEARVLSTPHMIGVMERTCRDTVLPLLAPGDDTVGTHIDVWHRAAAPIGAAVEFRVEVTAVDGR